MAGPLPLLTTEAVYKKLQDFHKEQGEKINIKDLFSHDADRFKKFRYVFLLRQKKITFPPLPVYT